MYAHTPDCTLARAAAHMTRSKTPYVTPHWKQLHNNSVGSIAIVWLA